MVWRCFFCFSLLLCWIGLFTACSPPAAQATPLPNWSPTPEAHPSTPTATLAVPTETDTPTPLPATSTTLPQTPILTLEVCSPLQGYDLDDLPDIISNPYNPPAPGSDDPHQGVDLADRLPDSQAAVTGMGVRAVLSGQVAGVVADRFPYGNAVLVETPLQDFPDGWLAEGFLPDPLPQPLVNPALTCPQVTPPTSESGMRSIYILYAHLQAQPEVEPGQQVRCGDSLGAIGESGNALNPHLHVEARVGPAGAVFSSMAHYDNRATQDEMGLYCLWRVSGVFQVIDPLVVFALQP